MYELKELYGFTMKTIASFVAPLRELHHHAGLGTVVTRDDAAGGAIKGLTNGAALGEEGQEEVSLTISNPLTGLFRHGRKTGTDRSSTGSGEWEKEGKQRGVVGAGGAK